MSDEPRFELIDPPFERAQRARAAFTVRSPASPWAKALAWLGAALVFGLAFVFSLVVLALAAAAGVVLFAWAWWRRRQALRNMVVDIAPSQQRE